MRAVVVARQHAGTESHLGKTAQGVARREGADSFRCHKRAVPVLHVLMQVTDGYDGIDGKLRRFNPAPPSAFLGGGKGSLDLTRQRYAVWAPDRTQRARQFVGRPLVHAHGATSFRRRVVASLPVKSAP
jgi:hypothetical protein